MDVGCLEILSGIGVEKTTDLFRHAFVSTSLLMDYTNLLAVSSFVDG